jgi:hypothetical protein
MNSDAREYEVISLTAILRTLYHAKGLPRGRPF